MKAKRFHVSFLDDNPSSPWRGRRWLLERRRASLKAALCAARDIANAVNVKDVRITDTKTGRIWDVEEGCQS